MSASRYVLLEIPCDARYPAVPVLSSGQGEIFLPHLFSFTDVRDFVEAATGECHYLNRTQRVRFLQRYSYNAEEYVYFDSDVGYFIGKDAYGRCDADSV